MKTLQNKSPSYTVGRGRPPVEHQFKKGQSGNPRGRPKSSSDFAQEIERQFDKHVTVESGGRSRSVTLRVQSIRSLMQQCLKGHVPALRLYLKLQQKFEPRGERKRPLIINVLKDAKAAASTNEASSRKRGGSQDAH